MSYQYIKETAQQIQAGWSSLSGASFGGVEFPAHTAALDAVLQREEKILTSEATLAGWRAQRDDLLLVLGTLNRRFYYGVLCSPEFGENTPFLNQCGYVRRSDRANGSSTADTTPALSGS